MKRYGEFDYNVEKELEDYKVYRERLRPYVVDTVPYMHNAAMNKKRILVEGANALMLDIDFGMLDVSTSRRDLMSKYAHH